MERTITPEPDPEHEEAIDAALARLLGRREGPRSAWWRAGVEENAEPELEEALHRRMPAGF